MKQEDRKISIWKTIFVSFWIWLIEFFFFINAMLYARDQILISSGIREVSFWGVVLVLFVLMLVYAISKSVFYIYKKESQNKKEVKKVE